MIQGTAYLCSTEREVLAQQIVRALNQMPGHLRQVFTVTHYEERTPEYIANKMGLGGPQIESLIRDANQLFWRTFRVVLSLNDSELDAIPTSQGPNCA